MTDLDDIPSEQREAEPAPAAGRAGLNSDQQLGMAVLDEVCEATEQDVRPQVMRVDGAYLYAELTGADVPATWGRYGQALDALQLLCNLIVSRRTRNDVRIILDADGYRERRADVLRQRALELAAEVKELNEEAELEPLPPQERRIIHTALVDDPDVSTYSEGDEPNRRVVISPRGSR